MEFATKKVLTLEAAKAIAAAAHAEATKNGWNMAICVVDDGGHLLYLERMDGTQLASVQVAQDKARTAVLFKRPTKALEDAVAGGRTVLLKLSGATPLEGGLPILVGSEVVGAIGVSGASAVQDGQVAGAGLTGLSGIQ
jgi:uncharacterized protein GlcG (DUF336 family)